ncbi:hypothetical protein HZC31_06365 [Candidatus Woesearchaeota archaeon]|nr:hypothetical protein [Candidatus Woesearchaeota archaeon]
MTAEHKEQQKEEQRKEELQKVVRFFFWIALTLLICITLFTLKARYTDEKESEMYAVQAAAENNPLLCENIKNLRLSSQCYSIFIRQGYDCTGKEPMSDACLIAQGVFLQDDLFCDIVFTGTKVPENLECRVSVFIERYTNEGLRDCCHIE